jgi:hypothetical protein
VLALEALDLAHADAVLAGAGAAHGDRPVDQPGVGGLGTLELVRIVRVEQEEQVKVAVADMADERCQQPCLFDVGLGLDDALGQSRDRHADIRRPAAAAGLQARAA